MLEGYQRQYEEKVEIIEELNRRNDELVSKVRDVEAVYAQAEGDASSASSLVIKRDHALATAKAKIEVVRVEKESLKKFLCEAQASPIVVKYLKKENSRLHKLLTFDTVALRRYKFSNKKILFVCPESFSGMKICIAPLLILANEHKSSLYIDLKKLDEWVFMFEVVSALDGWE
ncbi:hypothetical protein ACFE04_004619 [Oxalis oulophora]